MSDSTTERWAHIPSELRERPQWCISPGLDGDKAPRSLDGRLASSTNPSTWSSFEAACAAAAERGWHVGFMLHETDPFACIDLDVKEGTPDAYLQRHQRIIAESDSYTELSRSGLGWHVFVIGAIGKGRRRDAVEVYSQERFIICTGNVVHDRPIAERQAMLANMVNQMAPAAPPEVELTGDDNVDWSAAAQAAEDTGELGRLFRGDWEGRYESQSEADLALVKLLLPITESPLECWRTFRLSKLGAREKANRPDYARRTIALALQHLANDALHLQVGADMAAGLFWQGPAPHNERHFRLMLDGDLERHPPLRWLVKRVIPDAGTLTNDWEMLRESNPAKMPRFDAVVANPPFSYRWTPTDAMADDVRFKNYGLAPKSAADFAFLLHGFHFLKDDGVMAIILPHGVLFRGGAEARIRTKLLKDGHIDTVIGLPANLFYSTGIPVCILVLKRCKKPDDVLFINAAEHFVRGKRQNFLGDGTDGKPDHIGKIVSTYQYRTEEPRYSRRVSMAEIEENDFNLNISRYVSTATAEEEIDLVEVNDSLVEIEKRVKAATTQHNEFLRALALPLLP